jgi:Zn-dependent protease with chaperone function
MPRSVVAVVLAVLTAIAGCMATPVGTARDAVHTLVAVTLTGVVVVLAIAAREALRHRAIALALARLAQPGRLVGHAVGLIPGLDAAVVAGLREPLIYCGSDLPNRLDHEELRAVILHERHHQLHGAPRRLILLGAVAAIIRHSLSGRVWLERERARIEIAADAYALSAGVSRAALASALAKLSAAPTPAGLPAFATAADLRIRSLVGESTGLELDRSPAVRAALLGALVVAACFAVNFR